MPFSASSPSASTTNIFPHLLHPSRPSFAPPASSLASAAAFRAAGKRNTKAMHPSPRAAATRLDETSFLSSLMPKKEIGADRFIEARPEQDGRGVIIAIFDSGVDPAAAGLQVTSDGKAKILDILDCTGSGDIDTSEIVRADGNGCIKGRSGKTLVINSAWHNPSGEWHVGVKLVYELFTEKLTDRLKKERKKKWEEKNQKSLTEALELLNEFDKTHDKFDDISSKKVREDLQNKLDYLKKQVENYDDKGPVIDAVVWNDGDVWRVALDTQSWDDHAEDGRLADFLPMTNYRLERRHGVFSKLDACSFVTNVYDNGNLLSLVTDCSPHGTHVAGIAAAFHPEEPLLNGVAPGAQLISCKIGDSRLGSMETGTGLTRALIAAVEHKCDLINMSYGEQTLIPDYGRFVELVNEAVDKHRLVFVSSAGNNGPALSTVGSPGGTTTNIIGIGAYVSLSMAAGAHCVVDPPYEGEYTWSSRGPTLDGDLGVSLSAPGGAVAPVPTWTLQRRMLMNGTSMSSPSACGGVALLISALKAEGITVSPYTIRRALENTTVPIGNTPEDKLSTGQGLMQTDRALEYLLHSRNLPHVRYKVKITQSGNGGRKLRGIYLREASSCEQTSEWTVEVVPKFHEDAGNIEDLIPFEECIQLISNNEAVVKCPDFVLLTHNGRSFNIIVDPTQLPKGLHYFEVYGVDCKASWRGPLFRIPVTIIKPEAPIGRPPVISFRGLSFVPGQIMRKFIDVPHGATWVEMSLQASVFDTARKFFIDAVQICPMERPNKWKSTVTFTSPSHEKFNFPVKGGLTMELAIAQFWSSGVGSSEITIVDFEVVFHGITINRDEVVLDGSEAPVRIAVKSQLCSETLSPSATLNKIRVPYRPVDSKVSSLSGDRDKLPSGKQIMSLTLTYNIKLDEGTEIKPCIPLLNNRLYDSKFESQFYMISDSNKRVYATGDVYPKYVKLPKGEYILQLLIRHENILVLEKMKQLVLFMERKIDKKDAIQLNFFAQPDGPVMGNAFKSAILVPGKHEAFYVGPPANDRIPKNYPSGSVLLGKISYGKLSSTRNDDRKQQTPNHYRISYILPPSKHDGNTHDGKPTSNKNASERLNEQIRDAKLKFLVSLKSSSTEEKLAWKDLCSSLKLEYPRYTPLLSAILNGLVSGGAEDFNSHNNEIVSASNEVIDSIDKDELARYFSKRCDPDSNESEEIKKRMETMRDELANALYQKGIALAEIEPSKDNLPANRKVSDEAIEGSTLPSDDDKSNLFEENFKELKKWVDVKSAKFAMLSVIHEKRNGRLGTALKILDDLIQSESNSSKKKLYNRKIELLEEIGWDHVASYEKRWMQVRFPPCLPPL